MADVRVTNQECAVHCLHLGEGGAGDAHCCWCNTHFGSPGAAAGANTHATQTGVHVTADAGGPFYVAILANHGKR